MNSANILRPIDKGILVVIGLIMVVSGTYLVGPWYIETIGKVEQPVYRLFADRNSVIAFGCLQVIAGAGLLVAPFIKRAVKKVLTKVIFFAFLVRLYSTIGVVIALNGKFLPPNYLSQIGVVVMLGLYWLYLNKNEPK